MAAGGSTRARASQTLTAVTLAVAERDVPRVVFAAEYGSIYLTLMPPNAEAARTWRASTPAT